MFTEKGGVALPGRDSTCKALGWGWAAGCVRTQKPVGGRWWGRAGEARTQHSPHQAAPK